MAESTALAVRDPDALAFAVIDKPPLALPATAQPRAEAAIVVSVNGATVEVPFGCDEPDVACVLRDVVLDNLHYDPRFITERYLNRFVRQQPNNMPIFKYIKDLDGEVGKHIALFCQN